MNTRSYDLWKSFNTLLETAVGEIESEINTALGSSHSIDFYVEEDVSTYPSVRTRFVQTDGAEGRHHLARVQIDVYHQDTDPSPDYGLPKLITGSILSKLGLSTSQVGLYADHPIKDYFDNPVSPTDQDPFRLSLDSPSSRLKLDEQSDRLELDNATGWRDVPNSDPDIMHYQTLLKLNYRGV